MVFIPCPNACAVELRFTAFGEYVENTFSFYNPTEYDETSLHDIADKIAEWWYTYLRPQQKNYLVLRETYARALYSESGPTYTSSLHSGSAGGNTSSGNMPLNVTYCVTFRTAGRGRSYRGRNYMLGLHSSAVVNNQVNTTWRDNILTAYRRLLPGGGSDPTPHILSVISRMHNGTWRTVAVHTSVTSIVVANDDLDSMRRRLAGRGK